MVQNQSEQELKKLCVKNLDVQNVLKITKSLAYSCSAKFVIFQKKGQKYTISITGKT